MKTRPKCTTSFDASLARMSFGTRPFKNSGPLPSPSQTCSSAPTDQSYQISFRLQLRKWDDLIYVFLGC